MSTVAVSLSWVFIIATVLPLVRREAWWIRVFDFPRPQITLGAVVSAAALLWVFDSSALHGSTLAVLGLCAVYQGSEMSKYTRLRRVQSLAASLDDADRRFSILTANVLMTNRNTDQYLDLVRRYDPDIVVLAETDRCWLEKMRPLEETHPYSIECPLPNTYGLILYSRLKLGRQRILFRVEDDVPSFFSLVKLRTGDVIELHAIHPRPPHVGVDTVERDAELVVVAKEVSKSMRPVVVTGDLNDVAWSHTTRLFLRISGLLDPRVGRAFCNTFHSHYPLFRWPLDHLFHSRAFRLVKLERCPRTDSDHFAVYVELSYEPENRHEQERPVPDEEDFDEAQRKIENVLEKGVEPETMR